MSIGSLIWEDLDKDGLQDDIESGIADANVTLLDENGTVMTTPATITTGVDGKYYFSGLDEGSYSVQVTLPSNMGYVPCVSQTTIDNDDTENDSNIKTSIDNIYTSGEFTLQGNTEPVESNGKSATDDADDADDDNGNMTVDFCFYRPASLGDYVWKDNNKDGIQDADEEGVSGVTVKLLINCDSTTVSATTTTDINGSYLFSDLDAGDYCVEFSDLPVDYVVTTQGSGTATDSDAATIAPYKTALTTLDVGENDMTWDMGIYSSKASIGDLVWYDNNANGIQDAGEGGVNGIEVRLLDATCSTELNTTTTDVNGNYLFSNLNPDTYCLEFGVIPNGYAITQKDSGVDTTDSDVDPQTHKTIATTLDEGEDDISWDMGIYPLAEIGDRVWADNNTNGVQDAGESGVPSVTVTLYEGDCMTRAKEADGITDVPTDITSSLGEYKFTDLPIGNYCIGFSNIPAGYKVTPQEQGGDDATDSDVNVDTNKTISTTLDANESDMSWDMGIYQPATIGDRVWNDVNANGVQDAGEEGVESVTVTLYDSSCSVVATDENGVNIPTQTTDANGNYLFTELPPADYCLGFTNIPAGYAITPQDKGGDDATDSDVNVTTAKTVVTTLDPGEDDRTWDMGIYQEASIGNYVWNDSNANGEQEATESGVESVTVTLYQSDCETVAITNNGASIAPLQTDANGLYTFTHLMPGDYCLGFTMLPAGFGFTFKDMVDNAIDSDVNISTGKTMVTTLDAGENDMTWDAGIFESASIGDVVWYDTNANGVQDVGEVGVENIRVKLYQNDCATSAIDGVGSIITDVITAADGSYSFPSLVPNDYCVGFDLSTLPAGYRVSPQKVTITTADKDSNANPTTGLTEPTNLVGGENDLTWDMGIYKPASIGNFVWLDSNANGVQDIGESGVANVTVTLYEGDCATAVTTDNDGLAINPIQTDLNGLYTFSNLTPAAYCVGFDNLPADHVITKINQGSDLLDSDVNPASKRTISTVLDSGESDLSWDMGIYKPAVIGDRVWLDTNANGMQDTNETGVAGVTVTLYENDCATAVTLDDSGDAIAPLVTDANGNYLFTNLTPNEYCIGFSDLPERYLISSQNEGDDSNDSDVDVVTAKTISTELESGEEDRSWDMGIYRPAAIGDRVWDDKNGDGIQDANESGVADVNVTLYNCDCTTIAVDRDGVAIPSTLTDENGTYSFNELTPHDYCVGFTIPTGYTLSPQNSGSDDATDSDVNVDTNSTECTTLSSDENDTSWDMGIFVPASIGDRVWLDNNYNGIQDENESGFKDVNVTLYEADCSTEVSSMLTDVNGSYLFDNLVPNSYCVGFDRPEGYAWTFENSTEDSNDSDVNSLTNRTIVTTLESGENDLTWDAGLYQLSSLGDYVWFDENHDGIQDSNETAVKDVKVVLYESDCTTILRETRSDNDGFYLFENLEPSEYCIGFDELPIGYQFTPVYDNSGAGSDLDCNVDPGTGKTPIITLPYATNDLTWDMGIIPTCKDEEGRALQVFDDEIQASSIGSVTTINILSNDYGNLDIESIRFVISEEAEILWENGTAVGGVTLETVDRLVVEGEGVWEVKSDGTITFTAEPGFTGTPQPVYYIVKCKQGSVSNVAQASIVGNCVCETYEEKAVAAMNNYGMFLMLLLTSTFALLLFRKEFEKGIF